MQIVVSQIFPFDDMTGMDQGFLDRNADSNAEPGGRDKDHRKCISVFARREGIPGIGDGTSQELG
jgi:hypothetical protein